MASDVPTLGLLLRLLIIVIMFALSSSGSSAAAAVAKYDFESLRELQAESCELVRRDLNSRSEWRVVFDVSKSYAPLRSKDIAIDRLARILTELPIVKGDVLCLDTFARDYACGECYSIADWEIYQEMLLPTGRLGDALNLAIGDKAEGSEWTDFETVLSGMFERVDDPDCYDSCGLERPGEVIFLVLTDGRHDPPPTESSSEGELSRKISINSRVSDLCKTYEDSSGVEGESRTDKPSIRVIFVVDYTSLSLEDAPVRKIWRDQAEALAESSLGLRQPDRICGAKILVWDGRNDKAQLNQAIGASIDRQPGVHLCLEVAARALKGRKKSSSEDEGAVGSGRDSSDEGKDLEISPTSAMHHYGSGQDLTLEYLALGPWEGEVGLRLSSEYGSSQAWTRKLEIKAPTFDGWLQQQVSFSLNFDGESLNSQLLPVRGEVGGLERSDIGSFDFVVKPISPWGGAKAFLARPGHLPFVLGSLLLVCSWLMMFLSSLWPAELTLSIKDEPAPNTKKNGADKSHVGSDKQSPGTITPISTNGCRFLCERERGNPSRWSFTVLRTRPVQPPETRDLGSGVTQPIVIDAVHLGFLIYFFVWRKRGEMHPEVIDTGNGAKRECDLDGAVASIKVPKKVWRCLAPWKPSEWLKKGWGEPLCVDLDCGEVSFYVRLREKVPGWLSRIFAWIFQLGSLSGCAISVGQFLWVESGNVPSAETYQWLWKLWLGLAAFGLLDWLLRGFSEYWLRFANVASKVLAGSLWSSVMISCLFLALPRHPWTVGAAFLMVVLVITGILMVPHFVERRVAGKNSLSIAKVILDGLPFVAPLVSQP